MPNVVVVGGIIQCSHGGMIKLASGSDQLEIAGAAALTSGMEAGFSFQTGEPGVLVTPCPAETPAGSPSPCTATLPATTGVSTQLTVGGPGVLLDNASGLTLNTGGAVPPPAFTWSVAEAGQTLISVDQ